MSRFSQMHNDYLDPDKYGLFDDEEMPDNTIAIMAFRDFEGPYDLYRSMCKYSDCGMSLGCLIKSYDQPETEEDAYGYTIREKWYYGDDLVKFGSWKDMNKNGDLLIMLSLSSIVEGVEQTTQTWHTVVEPIHGDPCHIRESFMKNAEIVEEEAQTIWNETHGCCTCAKQFGINLDEELSPVWNECPDCGGQGVII